MSQVSNFFFHLTQNITEEGREFESHVFLSKHSAVSYQRFLLVGDKSFIN